ncbi:MAG: outer rane autotransporter [Verrucomicrobiales bacterium]|nr:outer rane autotransporter [Verrucomicrobiales bacterium]
MHSLIRRPWLGLIGLVPALASAQTTYDWSASAPGFSLTDASNWIQTGPDPDGFPNSPTATAQLIFDWGTAPIFTLDGNVQANRLFFDDTGATADVAGTIDPGAGGTLTLGGTDPRIEVRASSLTINAPLAASGLIKAGNSPLVLTGGNPGLTGSLTVSNVTGTNNNGVQFNNLAAMGGLTEIITQGVINSGGYVGIRNSMVVPATVSWNLSGQGGNSAPQGTIRSLGGNNVIEGPISLNTGAIRLTNAGGAGSSLTINGPITSAPGSGIAPIFRFGDGLGLTITNPANYWEGTTVHSQEIFRFAPGALPSTSGLQMSASANGHIETSGTLHRALGTGVNQMYIQPSSDAARTSGWSARGGALDLNIGGAGGDVKFLDSFTKTATFVTASNQVTVNNTTGLATGMTINITGFAVGTTITAITGNVLTASANSTQAQTNANANFHRTNDNSRLNTNGLVLNGSTADSTLTLANPLDVNGFGRTVQNNAANVTTVMAGGIKNTGAATGSLSKTGAGLMDITGPVDNTINFNANGGQLVFGGTEPHAFAGSITVNNGNVLVRKDTGLGAGGAIFNGTISTGGVIIDGTGVGPLTIDEATLTLGQRRANQANGAAPVPLQSHLRKTGNQPVTLTGTVITTTGGAVSMIDADGAGLFNLAGNLTSNATATRQFRFGGGGEGELSGSITLGSAVGLNLQKIGSGSWTISRDDNSFSGSLILTGGELRVPRIGSVGEPSSVGNGLGVSLLRFEGGALVYTGAGDTTDRLFLIEATGGSLIANGNGPLVFSYTGAHTVTTRTTFNASWATNGTVLATNDVGWMKVGMEVSAAGLASGTLISAIDIPGGVATLSLPATAHSGTAESVPVSFSAGAASLDRTFILGGSNAGANTIAGSLTDDTALGGRLGLRKTGLGRWVLGGDNSHTGPTLVETGTLQVDGTLQASAVTVGPNGVLRGIGTVQTDAIVQGTLAPGASVGNLAFGGALTWSGADARYQWEIADWNGAPGVGFDSVTAATADFTAVSAAQPVRIQVIAGAGVGAVSAARDFPLLRTTAGVTGFASNKFSVTVSDPTSSLPSGSWTVQQVSNDLVLRFQPGAAAPYDTWASGQGLTGANNAFDFDADGDGVPNGVEFVLDGAALNGGVVPAVNASVSGNNLSLSFLRRDDAASLNPVLEVSTTLAAGQWTTLADGVDGVTIQVTPNGTAPDLVVYNVPLTAYPVRFARLRVVR